MPKWMLSMFAAVMAMGLLAAPAVSYADTHDDTATEEPADEPDTDADEGG
jgi:hypothetical protein